MAIAPIAGVIVDRCNRKHLMMLGDMIAALSTIGILLLHLSGNLQIWQIYLTVAINGVFSQLQVLAYQVSIPMLVSRSTILALSAWVLYSVTAPRLLDRH